MGQVAAVDVLVPGEGSPAFGTFEREPVAPEVPGSAGLRKTRAFGAPVAAVVEDRAPVGSLLAMVRETVGRTPERSGRPGPVGG